MRAVVVLPTPRGPGKDERLRQPAGRDGVLQRVDDAALADDVFESLRTPFSRESDVRHDKLKQKLEVRTNWARAASKARPKGAYVASLFTSNLTCLAPPTAARRACGTAQDRLSAAAFRP